MTEKAFFSVLKNKCKLLKGKRYVLTRPLTRKIDGHIITVPAGFCADGASGPGIDSIDPAGWWVHDWLYATHLDDKGNEVSRSVADKALKHWHRRTLFKSFILKKMFNQIFRKSGESPVVFLKEWMSDESKQKLQKSVLERAVFV